MSVDMSMWTTLQAAASEALQKAYAPYSRFPVGAAALASDGRIVTGCNIENASYGLTLCAECSLISHLFLTGGGTLKAIVCVDGNGELLMPCGRCRQLIYEHAAPGMLINTPDGIHSIDDILPKAFGPKTMKNFVQK